MNVKEIRDLVDLVARRGIASLELEHAGFRIRIEGPRAAVPQASHAGAAFYPPEPLGAPAVAVAALPAPAPVPMAAAAAGRPAAEAGIHFVTSPIVGTFYRAPNPDADPFVKVGDAVEKGKVICIVEAMKLMNEIECDASGTVVEVFPQNGQPVEYGERLFSVRTK